MSKIYNSISNHAKKNPLDTSFTFRKNNNYESINYSQLLQYINSLSSYLNDYKNKTIAIIGNNKIEYAICLLTIISNIGNAFLVDKELSKEDINRLFIEVEPDLIIIDDEIKYNFNKIKTIKFSNINKIITKEVEYKYDKSFSGNLLLHTSGTTGTPKCVLLNEENYYGVIRELNNKWHVTKEQSCLLIIPLYHIYALTSLFHGLYAGINNILEWDYKRINTVLTQTKPHLFMGVPLMYNKIKDKAMESSRLKIKIALIISKCLLFFHIDLRKKIFKQIHDYFGGNYIFGCSAGSLIPPETSKFFEDIGLPIYNVYGMTETSGPIAINYKNNNKYDSVGKILNINKIKIINKDENGIGNILVKGSNVFNGYINDNKNKYINNKYFDTGDLGYVKDNFLYVIGRQKNILIGSNGKNISPQELIKKVLKNNKIHDCNIIIENDRLVAIVNTKLSEKELQKYIDSFNKKLPKYKRIYEFKIIDKKVK